MDKPLGQCCGCLPIRQGVGCIAVLLFVNSVFEFFGLWTDDMRVWTGGYENLARWTIGILGMFGLVFCPLGLLGAYENTASFVRYFYYYVVFRLVVVLIMGFLDFHELSKCESHAYFIQHRDEYNRTLDSISKAGTCGSTRTWYFLILAADLLLTYYFSSVSGRLSHVLEYPAYLIGFEKRPPGALGSKKKPPHADDPLVGHAYTSHEIPHYHATENPMGQGATASPQPPAAKMTSEQQEKVKAQMKDIFKECDENQDGTVSKIEFIRALRSKPDVAKFFNLSGKFGQESKGRTQMERVFQGIDHDGDKKITWEELMSVLDSMQLGPDGLPLWEKSIP